MDLSRGGRPANVPGPGGAGSVGRHERHERALAYSSRRYSSSDDDTELEGEDRRREDRRPNGVVGPVGSLKGRLSPTHAVYAAGVASLLAGYSGSDREPSLGSLRLGGTLRSPSGTRQYSLDAMTGSTARHRHLHHHHFSSGKKGSPSRDGGSLKSSASLTGTSASLARDRDLPDYARDLSDYASDLPDYGSALGSRSGTGTGVGVGVGRRERERDRNRDRERDRAERERERELAVAVAREASRATSRLPGMSSASSISSASSDNASDLTYPEMDAVLAESRRLAMESEMGGDSPPEPAPPEPAPPDIPPRGPSLHHARGARTPGAYSHQGSVLDGAPGDPPGTPQQVPTPAGSCAYLSQEYLRSSYGTKSPSRSPAAGALPNTPNTANGNNTCNGTNLTREKEWDEEEQQYIKDASMAPTLASHHRLTSTAPNSAIMAANPQLTPAVLPSFPASLRAGSGAAYSPYSPSRFHIDKRCQSRCSWKACALGLILVCVVLTATLAYFGAVGLDPNGCSINVHEKDLVRDEASLGLAPSQTSPTEESLPTSTAVQYASPSSRSPQLGDSPEAPPDLPSVQQHQQQQLQQVPQLPPQQQAAQGSTWPAATEVRELGVVHSAIIPPFQFWNSEFRNKNPAFVRFNFTLPWGANFAVYGRRNVAPSITQHDFVEFIKAGRLEHRSRRSLDHVAAFVSSHSYYGDHEYEDDPDEEENRLSAVSFMAATNDTKFRHDRRVWNIDADRAELRSVAEDTKEVPSRPRRRRSSGLGGMPGSGSGIGPEGGSRSMRVNVSLLQYLDTGRWFLSVYNDDLRPQDISLSVTREEGVSRPCPNDCSGHGSCYLGKCDCIEGFEGNDCSKSMCPVMCSNHGKYGGGMCHCEGGWKGPECDVPARDCQIADCSGHGRCVGGRCECQPGWKGDGCEKKDCEDPTCSGHGTCVDGSCYCKAGWQGPACAMLDQQVYQCLPGCSNHGTYDLESGACKCDPYWTGPDCSQELCGLDCGPHGYCDEAKCKCRTGWTGERCDQLPCDQRCSEHGQCKNGTCVCLQGWNGRHCTLPGCINSCSRNGSCMLEDGEYHCVCSQGWAGRDCGIQLETNCSDNKDNDNDGLADCMDSDCCQKEGCLAHVMCVSSMNPVEVLLRKQPPLVTAAFYQRVKFLVEERSVQSYAQSNSYTERRVSVVRGRVVTPQGLGIIGARVSVSDAKLGFTLTRIGGWFDMLVNGGGAVTLQFMRNPSLATTRTVFVPWSQIVVLPPVVLPVTPGEAAKARDWDAIAAEALGFQMPIASLSLFPNQEERPCEAHDHELLKPIIVSTWMPDKVGGLPGRSLVFAETQILQESIRIPGSDLYLQYLSSQAPGYLSTVLMQLTHDRVPPTLTHVHVTVQIEGSVHTKTYEADPNLTHVFAWNKRNVYRQKVYGVSYARISIGYKHSTCRSIIWETQMATLQGFDVDISDIGGWSLNNHHYYNFHEGILQKGDGTTLHLKRYPRTLKVVVGTGLQRPLQCTDCNGKAKDAALLSPVALAAGPDGSLYIGDFNLIRRVTPGPNSTIFTVLQLSATQVAHQHYLTVSPADGHLYVSDSERHQILRVINLEPEVEDPHTNFEVAVGSGERCVPGDEKHCGDGGPALKARLAHPKGIVISTDKTMYIADGTNIRAVSPLGIIHTLVGHHGHHNVWQPIPCQGAIPASQAELQWPTGLALSPLDGSLHFIDDRVVLKLTSDRKVKVVAGTPLHCHNTGCNKEDAKPKKHRASPSPTTASIEELLKKKMEMGSQEGTEATSTVLGFILAITFSPNGELFIAEADSKRVNAIRVVDSAGWMSDFAGRPQQQEPFYRAPPCDCANASSNGWASTTNSPSQQAGNPASWRTAASTLPVEVSCSCAMPQDEGEKNSRETLLSSNAQFTSISAIVVAPDGVLHVADQGSLHVLALDHYLPSYDELLGEFRIPFPPSGEIYVFNKYGQHIATKDLTTNNRRYSFLYSKNTSFGKLSSVKDAADNQISIFRDYSGVPFSIENTQKHKCDFNLTNVGLLKMFTEPGRSEIHLDYDSNSGLLTSRADAKGSGGKTFLYRYNELGRINNVILPTGETLDLTSRISLDGGLTVQISAPQSASAIAGSPTDPRSRHRQGVTLKMEGRGSRRLVVSDGLEKTEAMIFRNGSLSVRSPYGGVLQCSARRRHPLLEVSLPVEAEMLPMWSDQVSETGMKNTMGWTWNIVGDAGTSEHTLHQELWVNHSRVLGVEYNQAANRKTFYDRDSSPLLTINLNDKGMPSSWAPADGGQPVNISYDWFNRVGSWSWGNQVEKYTYDLQGLLTNITNSENKTLQFGYNNTNMPCNITLPSGRVFKLHYDADGGLKQMTLPNGMSHTFSVQPSLGFLRSTYTAPGTSKPYLQHFSYSGLLLLTVFPGDGARIVYKYTPTGKLAEIVHGDGKSQINYSPNTGYPTSVLHAERDLEYRWDFSYSGGILTEERIEFEAKSGLANAKFSYEYDDNYRLLSISGRIGGGILPDHSITYSPKTGAPTQIGEFQVQRGRINETLLSDGTAVFTKITNDQMQEVQVALTIHNMEVFRMEFSYDSRGRINKTRTYTRTMPVSMYTTEKNYTWDDDGQLIKVWAQEPWAFHYDQNGNLLSLFYKDKPIPMVYNQMDRIVKCDDGIYHYDSRGLVIQNAREERFHYNAKGLLVRTYRRGRFDVRYYYDHLDRLTTRKDNFGNITQFFYTNHERPYEVTQIYNPRDLKLMSLVYDERGHLVFATAFKHKYYIATDQCGTPVMVFNQYGELLRDISRSPYGQIIYDSNPYLYLPIDFCGGLLDRVVSIVHMPGGKVYDPLIGQLMGPAWEDIPARLNKPTHLSLYRFNGNDPINVRKTQSYLTDHSSWLTSLGYNLPSLAPQLYKRSVLPPLLSPLRPPRAPVPPNLISESAAQLSMAAAAADGSAMSIMSGFLSQLSEKVLTDQMGVSGLSGWPAPATDTASSRTIWPPSNPLSNLRVGSGHEPPFGRGIVVSRTPQGQAVINSVPSANSIYRDVFTSVFNGSYMLDVSFLVHGYQDTFFFVQPREERVSEDKAQLKRLGNSFNTTFNDKEKSLDLKIHSPTAVINLRYGTTPEKEKQRILHHAKTTAEHKAWHREKDALRFDSSGSVDWSNSEKEEILRNGLTPSYEGQYIHDIYRYPELAEDPYNIRFVKKSSEPGSSVKRKRSPTTNRSGGVARVALRNVGETLNAPGTWWKPCTEYGPPC